MKELKTHFAPSLLRQLATEQRVNLVWHPASTPPSGKRSSQSRPPSQPPISIVGWFEYGSQLDTVIVFPKFVWRQTFQSGMNMISRVPYYIPLLTIVGVVTPSTLDRTIYPFARLDRSCCVRTHDGRELVFEAPTPQGRDLFVNRLKVLVARLASSVIVHDEAMLREFFSPTGTESFADFDDEMSADDNDEDLISPTARYLPKSTNVSLGADP